MATATPLTHPNEAVQNEQYFSYRLTVYGIGAAGQTAAVAGQSSLKATYLPAMGAEAGTFALEAESVDRILLLGVYEIQGKPDVVLIWPNGTTKRRFSVQDKTVLPNGRTMLTVTPKT